MNPPIRTVLFDLDGTLLDTAPDLACALNAVLQANGRAPLSLAEIRPAVSHGGGALITLGFGLPADHPEAEPHRQALLRHYQDNIAAHTRLFPGMDAVLETIESQQRRWGIVTNKPGWLTNPLLDALHLRERAASVVCGDTLEHSKPHPAPLLYACEQTGTPPAQALYIGDAERDIQAGRSAGMRTLVALFGYLTDADRPETWGASALIEKPVDILGWLS